MTTSNEKSKASAVDVVEDVLLGSLGKAIPPSDVLDHAVRFFGTWSGSDKLMMTSQYTAKLAIYILTWRAELLYRTGRRAKPASPSVEGLFKLAGTLSQARRVSGLWGFLGIMKGLSALERNRPPSRTQLTLQRIQGLSMLVFYPLEFISFFTAPWAPVLSRWVTPKQGAKAAIWSVRAWGVYVLAQVLLLLGERTAMREREAEKAKGKGVAEQERDEEAMRVEEERIRKRKAQIVYQLVANVSRLPVIAHWSFENGVYPYEFLTTALSLISALAAFRGGWENTRLPSPTSR